jgi:Ca2+-transporting ATPase
VPTVAGTTAFVTFVFVRRSTCSTSATTNRSAFVATAAVIVLLVLVVEMDVAHGFFTTTDLTSAQWLACAAIGSTVLWVGELVKIFLRARGRRLASR